MLEHAGINTGIHVWGPVKDSYSLQRYICNVMGALTLQVMAGHENETSLDVNCGSSGELITAACCQGQ